jgi:hypothetical protein
MKYALPLILFLLLVLTFLRGLDFALEIDDLKSQVRIQKKSLVFLERLSNQALPSCSVSESNLKSIAESSGYTSVTLDKDKFSVGFFQGKKFGDCVTEIRLIGLP